jgi:uncharacterized protein (DUF58 family)
MRALQQLLRKIADAANAWLFQLRDSEPGEVWLNRRRVFIVPTRAGLAFAALLLLMFIGSINYNLGLGFALTFLLAGCGVADMVLTSNNLAGLHLAPGRAPSVFAGDAAGFELHLINRSRRDRFAVRADFIAAGAPRHVADVAAGGSAVLLLTCPTSERGWMAAPRVRLLTRFPLGLFESWSYWQPGVRVLVYPAPETPPRPLPLATSAAASGNGRAGGDDFAGLRAYRAGDPMRHLAWRQIARFDPGPGAQLLSKHFEGGAAAELTLDFNRLPAAFELERRLARMTRWVLDAEQLGLPYGFRLGALYLKPALGQAQRDACLGALALYGRGHEPQA